MKLLDFARKLSISLLLSVAITIAITIIALISISIMLLFNLIHPFGTFIASAVLLISVLTIVAYQGMFGRKEDHYK